MRLVAAVTAAPQLVRVGLVQYLDFETEGGHAGLHRGGAARVLRRRATTPADRPMTGEPIAQALARRLSALFGTRAFRRPFARRAQGQTA
jgi:hypothetical protein